MNNVPDATICTQCHADLLPGKNAKERVNESLLMFVIGIVSGGLAYLSFQVGGLICGGIGILLGIVAVIALGPGIYFAVVSTPLFERYLMRARRHKDLDIQQAISDCTRALELSPKKEQHKIQLLRGELYVRSGLVEEGGGDLLPLIEKATQAIELASLADKPKRLAERATLYEKLGLSGEAVGDIEAQITFLTLAIETATANEREKKYRDRAAAYTQYGRLEEGDQDLLNALMAAEAFASKSDFKPGETTKAVASVLGMEGSAFDYGWSSSQRSSEMKRINAERLEMIKAGKVVVFGYCKNCKEVVEPTLELHCPMGHGKIKEVVYVLNNDAKKVRDELRQKYTPVTVEPKPGPAVKDPGYTRSTKILLICIAVFMAFSCIYLSWYFFLQP